MTKDNMFDFARIKGITFVKNNVITNFMICDYFLLGFVVFSTLYGVRTFF